MKKLWFVLAVVLGGVMVPVGAEAKVDERESGSSAVVERVPVGAEAKVDERESGSSAVLERVLVGAEAQVDEREPGIYAVVDGESVPLVFGNGTTAVSSTGVLGVELGKTKVSYKGAESGVVATGTFVMVVDPEKKAVTKTLKAYNPFIKSMTPANVLVLPLTVEKGKRVYDEGLAIEGIRTSVQGRMDFEWEQISDNSFEIRVLDLVPGEYGFVFKASKLAGFDYSAIFGFTVAE